MTSSASYFMSPYGPYSDIVSADTIPSRQAALRYGWFRDPEDNCPAVYVRRSKNGRTQHFRRIESFSPANPQPGGESTEGVPSESPEHLAVKDAIVDAVSRCIHEGESMPWAFRDRRFHWAFHGDLLEGVTNAEPEYTLRFPDGRIARPDVALIGSDYAGRPSVRWAVEIMRDNELSIEKMMKIYSMGLPTIVLDIAGINLDNVDADWARDQLLATCTDDPHGRRRNFIHLPDTLRTVLNDWSLNRGETGRSHKFIVFGSDKRILSIRDRLKAEARELGLPFTRNEAKDRGIPHTDIAAPNNTNEQTEKEFQNARQRVADGWVELTGDRYLRIQTPVPAGPGPAMDFHRSLAHHFAADGEVIVGYDPRGSSRVGDRHIEVPTWPKQHEPAVWRPLAPKVLCFPVGLHLRACDQVP